MNTPVSFEIAKLLKDKGFDEPVNNYTSERDGDYFSNEKQTISYKNYNEIRNVYAAPTIAEVVMWVHKEKGLWVNVMYMGFELKYSWSIDIITTSYRDWETDRKSVV